MQHGCPTGGPIPNSLCVCVCVGSPPDLLPPSKGMQHQSCQTTLRGGIAASSPSHHRQWHAHTSSLVKPAGAHYEWRLQRWAHQLMCASSKDAAEQRMAIELHFVVRHHKHGSCLPASPPTQPDVVVQSDWDGISRKEAIATAALPQDAIKRCCYVP